MQKATTRTFASFIGLILFFGCLGLQAQNDDTKKSFYDIILQLESEHEILFSYVIEEVQAYRLVPPENTLDLENSLQYLNNKSPFRIQKLSDRYYTISKKPIDETSLCGTLIDALSGLVLSNANIQGIDGSFSAISDTNGIFYIPENYTLDIAISYLGYETLQLPTSELGTDCPAILLTPKAAQLNEVLVQSILVQGIDRNSNGSTSLRTQNFGLLPGQTENDVLQMAQALPGVESVNETISTINVRGGTNDENLILWEGIRMYQLGHFFGLISAFNPSLTKELTLYKNGTPSRYGGSVSGVIEMNSNNEITNDFQAGVGTNLINTNAFLEMPLGKNLGIQVSGRTSINDIVETPVYTNFSNRVFQDTEITNNQNSEEFTDVAFKEDFYFYDVGGKLLWDPTKKDKIRLNLIAMENHFEFSERLSTREETSRLEQKSQAGGISWDHQWTPSFATSVSFGVSHYLLDAINQDILSTQEINQENEVLDLSGQLDSRWQLSSSWSLFSGYQFSEVGVSNTQDVNLPRFRDYEKDVLRTHSLFSTLRYRSNTDRTRFDIGLRGNYFDKLSKASIEPRLSFYQELLKGFALEVGGEIRSQTLTQRIDLQSDFLGIEKRRWILADDMEVPVKTSQQISLGFLYHKQGWFLNIEGFYKHVDDITAKSQGFQNQFQFSTGTGSYMITGVEFTANKKYKNLSAWISYAYTQNDYTFDSFVPSEFANNLDLRHTLKVASSYSWNRFKFAVGLNYHSGRPFTQPKEDAPYLIGDGFLLIDFEAPNSRRVTDYLRLDFSAEYLWEVWDHMDAKFNLALLNLTDRENTLNIRYSLDDPSSFDSEINRIEEVSLGFTPNLSIQLLF